MKLHFEPDLDYQQQAVKAVCDLFRGQESCRTEFTVALQATTPDGPSLDLASQGVGNRLTLSDELILRNLNEIQLRNGLPPSSVLSSGDFTVEMETGTGKTYVYLRTIFELNKRYGFTKFIIVVPSVAIKEGVYKTLQITKDHFKALYAGIPFEYFLYDSAKPGQVRNFATGANIQIMVVTVGAINKKDVNNLYKDNEKMGDEKPIDLIRQVRPILIVDEPQSVDGGLDGRGKQALDAMSPLCTLRYSATHVHQYHMVYKLDAVDAYERRLVKQIEVASATVENAHNQAYVRFIRAMNNHGTISAVVELDVDSGDGVRRKEISVCDGDDLEQITGRSLYGGFRVGEIRTARGEEYVELRHPGGETFLLPGQARGDMDVLAMQRQMIRRTIQEHLDKELRLCPQGIKVLSLFFIDEVSKYRHYTPDGTPAKGEYARIFEEEYRRASKLPRYNTLFQGIDLEHAAGEAHDGYFSIDRKGGWVDPELNKHGEIKNEKSRESAERAYNLIMKDKEKLLSFETPLKFIFSHSALKEGWDNPNVFQICTLRDMGTERERRQTLGRGLRLCVNQHGDRIRGFEVNTLTVIATESYEEYAENLQKEIEAETGIRFGVVEEHQFAALAVTMADGKTVPLGLEKSKALWEVLRESGYIDAHGKVQDTLKTALREDALVVPTEFEAQKTAIVALLCKLSGKLDIKNADERLPIKLRKDRNGKAVYLSDDFRALWDRIKQKTTYRVDFDNARLIRDCITDFQKAPRVTKARLQWKVADLAIGKSGVEATEKPGSATITLDENVPELPDLLTNLQDRTHLTRRSLVEILIGCQRLQEYKTNPQQFIELATETINRRKQIVLVDGIKYRKLGDQHVYAQELFAQQELTGYLKNMFRNATKSVYESVVYDSGTERDFAEALENNEAVKLYVKLPGWFKVPTPLGSYNPDWALMVEKDGDERLYFVVETKSGLFRDELREVERGKIDCGEAHFEAVAVRENPAQYVVGAKLADVITRG